MNVNQRANKESHILSIWHIQINTINKLCGSPYIMEMRSVSIVSLWSGLQYLAIHHSALKWALHWKSSQVIGQKLKLLWEPLGVMFHWDNMMEYIQSHNWLAAQVRLCNDWLSPQWERGEKGVENNEWQASGCRAQLYVGLRLLMESHRVKERRTACGDPYQYTPSHSPAFIYL